MANDPIQPSLWWRFDRYVIDGGAIRPAPQAHLHSYDPWQLFREVKQRYRTVETLWGQFAELTRRLQQTATEPFQPSPAGQEEILAWCNRYGLLGILPGQALKIHLPPTYERGQDYLPKMGGISESSYRARVYRSYERIAGHWLVYRLAQDDFDLYGSGWTPGQLAPLKDGEKFDTTWWDWIEFEWKTEETVPALQRYFPEPCRNAQYPRPLSAEFWPVYQEPVSEWMRSAITFTHAVELTSNDATERFSASRGTPNQATQDIGLWRLNALAGSEASYFEFGKCVLQEERSSASLLGAMAKMFLLDVIAERRLLRCSHCGRFFVTNVQRAKYCSVRCRNTSQSRRYRAARKAKPTDPA